MTPAPPPGPAGGGLARLRAAGRQRAKRALRAVAGPLPRYLDRRFEDLHTHVDQIVGHLYARVAIDVETMSEISLGMQRLLEVNTGELRDVVGSVAALAPGAGRLGPLGAALGRLAPGSRVLRLADVAGPGAGLSAAALASMGHRATEADVADGDLPAAEDGGGFDCVVWDAGALDAATLDRVRAALRAGGELVVSVAVDPVGAADPDDGPLATLEKALAGWSVHDRQVVVCRPRGTWAPAGHGPAVDGPAEGAPGAADAAVGVLRASPA
ncbi:MAG: hypothetical protein ABR511_03970 [Acidimicrobiales bacterium]